MREENPSGELWHRAQFCSNTFCPRSWFAAWTFVVAAFVRGDCGVPSVWLTAIAPPMAKVAASRRRPNTLTSTCFIVIPPVSHVSMARSSAAESAKPFNTWWRRFTIYRRSTNTGYRCFRKSVSRNSLKVVTGLSRIVTDRAPSSFSEGSAAGLQATRITFQVLLIFGEI
jgi:hypothetical protein